MRDGAVRVTVAVGVVLALAVGGVALGLAASGSPGTTGTPVSARCSDAAPKLTVQGSGLASATPNLVTVVVDVTVTDAGAQASLTDDNTRANAVTAAFEHGGVALKDIQTSNVSLNPQYSLSGAITGYQMSNTITAKLRDFSTAGTILDSLTGAAGNATRIQSLTFSIEDPRTVEDQARSDAVRQAVSHAQSMAGAAGERLGPVCSLSDQTSVTYPSYNNLAFSNGAPAAAAQALPLQPGTQQETAQVTLVYALEPPASGR
jgi:uncharacterized protein YggE